MSTTETITAKEQTTSLTTSSRLQLNGFDSSYGDFRDDLARDGYAIVKGVIPADRAAAYVDRMYSWLEGFNLGFDHNDLSTVREDTLPIISEKGMCLNYGVSHEKFVWDIRAEPGVVSIFEKVYDTEDLLVSFDGVNFSFPNRKDIAENKPWPHQDQDPDRPGFRCLQGLVNLLPNGPKDGGLIVCKGAHLLSEQFHNVMKGEKRLWQWTNEWYGFTEDGIKWLADKGTEWVKVNAEPGDLLLWDSRTPHYNLPSTSSRPRFCVYTCYMPVSDASEQDLINKKAAFEAWKGTTHWPNAMHTGSNEAKRGGKLDPHNRFEPIEKPVLSERAFKLTGIPYIK